MYKQLFLLALGLSLAGCPEKMNPYEGPFANTTISGTLSLLGPVEGAEVCASTYGGEKDDSILYDCGTTDAQGRYTLHAGYLFGTIIVKATVPKFPESSLFAVVPSVRQYDFVDDIHITPVSHLTEGYYRHLVDHERLGHPEALAIARDELNRHFGGLPHHVRAPWIPPAEGEPKSQLPLVEGMEMYFYAGAMEGLAWKLSAEANLDDSSKITIISLLQALYDDIWADGVFDGVGGGGSILQQEGIPLHGDTLRHDLAGGLALFVRSEKNPTKMRIQEVRSFLTALSRSRGRIFSDAGHYFEDQGPQLASCIVAREGGEISSLDYPQRGVVEVICRWVDSFGVKSGTIEFNDFKANSALELLKMNEDGVSAVIDTCKLDNGASYTLNLSATNVYGTPSIKSAALRIQNEALKVTQIGTGSAWVKPGEPLRVFGQVEKPLRRVTLSPSELDPLTREYTFEERVTKFDIIYPEAYVHGRFAVTVELEDWSGGVATHVISVAGDQTPPRLLLIPGTFRQEDGSGLIDLRAWEIGTAPTFFKYYDRMDFLPEQGMGTVEQNLPALKFRVDDHEDAQVGADSSELRVEYSYAMGNSAEYTRGWEALSPARDGVYTLPIAYQTILPLWAGNPESNFLARSQPTDEHRISIRVTDPAGNVSIRQFRFLLHLLAPPVRVWGCGASGSLQGAQLVNPNFGIVFARGFDLYDARLQYDLNLPMSTLTPRGGMVVRVEKDPLQAQVTDVKVTRGKFPHGRDYLATLTDEKLAHRARAAFETAHLRRCRPYKRIAFEDGTCARLYRNTAYPEVETRQTFLPASQDVSLMALKRDFIEEAPVLGTDVTLAPNNPYLLRTRTAETPVFADGRTVAWNQAVIDADGTRSIELATRYGVEAEGGRDTFILERVSVAGFKLIRPPMRVSLIASMDGGLPTPSILVDASCTNTLSMQWGLAQEAPIQASL